MAETKIRVLVIPVGEAPEVREIENTQRAIRREIGGDMFSLLWEVMPDLWLIRGWWATAPPVSPQLLAKARAIGVHIHIPESPRANFAILNGEERAVTEIVCGPVVAVAIDTETGVDWETKFGRSLTGEEVLAVQQRFVTLPQVVSTESGEVGRAFVAPVSTGVIVVG